MNGTGCTSEGEGEDVHLRGEKEEAGRMYVWDRDGDGVASIGQGASALLEADGWKWPMREGKGCLALNHHNSS